MEPTSEMARSELRAELGCAGAPGHPEDGLGGRGVHGPQLAALLPPYDAGVGTAPQSLLRLEETASPRWFAATGTAVWPAAATAAEEEEKEVVSARGSLARVSSSRAGRARGKQGRGMGAAAGISLMGPLGAKNKTRCPPFPSAPRDSG